MDGFDVDVSELNSLTVDLGKAAVRVGADAAQAVRKTTFDIERTAKQFAPVDTGALRNSIGHDFTGDGRSGVIESEIGPTVDYGLHVEVGTSRTAPQGYMGPAYDLHIPDLVTALERNADPDL